MVRKYIFVNGIKCTNLMKKNERFSILIKLCFVTCEICVFVICLKKKWKWDAEEEAALTKLVDKQNGIYDWNVIAQRIYGRSGQTFTI